MAAAEKSLIALAWTIQRVESPVSQYAPEELWSGNISGMK
jgi:hypothetical protein